MVTEAEAFLRGKSRAVISRLSQEMQAASDSMDFEQAARVRDRIRALIDAERPESVLSDDAIMDILKKDGVDIARRTVAKYREGMNIASSVQRRREKRARAALTA